MGCHKIDSIDGSSVDIARCLSNTWLVATEYKAHSVGPFYLKLQLFIVLSELISNSPTEKVVRSTRVKANLRAKVVICLHIKYTLLLLSC